MDFMDEAAPERLREALGGPADLVLSDMAANTVGHPQTDHLRTMALVEAGLEFATRSACGPGGAFVAKVLAGGADNRSGRRAQAPFHHREARQAARQPQGLERMVRHRPGLQGRSRSIVLIFRPIELRTNPETSRAEPVQARP